VRDRFLDSGAIFTGWVGLGMALVLAISFELIIPLQTVVFLLAPLMGALIGVYANVRSERWRPRWRVLANAAYAGVVTGIGMALVYVVIRVVFLYGDTGFPAFNRADPDTGKPIPPFCQNGPGCTYARYVDQGQTAELAALGITDAASLEAAEWRALITTGAGLIVLTLIGSAAGGAIRGFSAQPGTRPAALPEGAR
jgi:hypothetical protein